MMHISSNSYLMPKLNRKGGSHIYRHIVNHFLALKSFLKLSWAGLNTKDEQVTLLRNMAALRRLRHPHVMGLFGMCMEGAPVTPDGTEAMVLTPRTHFHLTLRRLLIWTRENNPKVSWPLSYYPIDFITKRSHHYLICYSTFIIGLHLFNRIRSKM